MVEGRCVEELEHGAGAAVLGAVGAEDDAVDAALDQGAGTHGAGLEGAVEGAAFEAPVAGPAAGLADGGDLRVREGRVVGVAAVVAPPDDLSVADDHGADRDFAECGGLGGLAEGSAHIAAVERLLLRRERLGNDLPVQVEFRAVHRDLLV